MQQRFFIVRRAPVGESPAPGMGSGATRQLLEIFRPRLESQLYCRVRAREESVLAKTGPRLARTKALSGAEGAALRVTQG